MPTTKNSMEIAQFYEQLGFCSSQRLDAVR